MAARRTSVVAASAVRRATLAVVAAAFLVGCGSEESSAPTSEGACAAVADYEGRRYVGTAWKVAPEPGDRIGEATLPACRDTPDAPAEPAQTIGVAAVAQVPEEIAIQELGSHPTLYIREGVEPSEYPEELARLLRAPTCDPQDEPITLSGPWRSILAADGGTELDLVPPYDLGLSVAESSSPAYEGAELTVRVPEEAGRPIDRDDIEGVLWSGGNITVTVRCERGKFVAGRVVAGHSG